jgi:hypothetical protein
VNEYKKGLMSELFLQCRKKKVIVRGGTASMKACLAYNETGRYNPINISRKQNALNQFRARFLCLIADNYGYQLRSKNEEDPVTSTPLSLIPRVYLVHLGNEYFADVRSINSLDTVNPYTRSYTLLDRQRIERLNRWLGKWGYSLFHSTSLIKDENNNMQRCRNLFSSINRHFYASPMWFTELDFNGLLNLYRSLYHLWYHQLDISDEDRRNATGDIRIFADDGVSLYDNEELQRVILQDVEILTSRDVSGTMALYFMMGLVRVSEDAAACNPSLAFDSDVSDDE